MPKVWNKRDPNVPKDAVYVGRPTKWGNPFIVGMHGDRDHVVKLFRVLAKHVFVPYIESGQTLSIDFNDDDELNNWKLTLDRESILELKGKDLVCWCAPKPCHADVLLELANADHSETR